MMKGRDNSYGGHDGQPTGLTSSQGTYRLFPLIADIQLAENEEDSGHVRITCVEVCDENLYLGTSHGEILHYVSLPTDDSTAQAPSYIFASRLPTGSAEHGGKGSPDGPGVQQILLLPRVQKACVLSNGILSFYSLPELSPAFGNTTVANCTWVGGLDLDEAEPADDAGVVVMICVKSKVRLVRIAEEVRRVKDIQYSGCLASVRRGEFACVADATGYSLLDVEHQQKISLFPISSLDDNEASGRVEDVSGGQSSTISRSSSTASRAPISEDGRERGHGRSTSLGAFNSGYTKRHISPQPPAEGFSGLSTPSRHPRDPSPLPSPSPMNTPASRQSDGGQGLQDADKPLPSIPPRTDSLKSSRRPSMTPLRPHICSPTSTEFLLTTGTSLDDAGVGLFVNLDGDVVRGTLEFEHYPTSIALDLPTRERDESESNGSFERGFILATVPRSVGGKDGHAVEIQRLDLQHAGEKEWLEVPSQTGPSSSATAPGITDCGLRSCTMFIQIRDSDVGSLLGNVRIPAGSIQGLDSTLDEEYKVKRDTEETTFADRLGSSSSRMLLWAGNAVWSLGQTSLLTKFNAILDRALEAKGELDTPLRVDRTAIIRIATDLRSLEPSTETEFLSLEFLRQKASLLLFGSMLVDTSLVGNLPAADIRITESLLMDGGLDPRVLIMLLPALRSDIDQGSRGIWIHAGLLQTSSALLSRAQTGDIGSWPSQYLHLIKRFLGAWRQRKGFGSISDEEQVFQTIDAALLRILVIQDAAAVSVGPLHRVSPERAELYSFVDSGVDGFDRAVKILQEEHQLFVLSRLYQSRRMARKVLETWRRIIDGEEDRGKGLVDGEDEVRKYLINVRDTGIVEEFATWLAGRNPALGVQIFTNESNKVKWEPHQVVMLLQRRAPGAVKEYLEHLVFGKKHTKYANDLISYYLDNVLSVLGSSRDAQQQLARTYELYRALRPPKPTYREYITANAPTAEPWWHDRLRLLELIGGSHGSDFTYNVDALLGRIEPFETSLVPEMIILDGRRGRHQQALRLLTQGLADYHTAVSYCLLGGASIFHPAQGAPPMSPTSLGRMAAETNTHDGAKPPKNEQFVLFGYLLAEFLRIEDETDRLERTAELLARFGQWYDLREVLEYIPDTWSVELLSTFLVGALRRLRAEKNQSTVAKALSGAENLQISHALVEKIGGLGPVVDTTGVNQANA